jgi:hypothetical protein
VIDWEENREPDDTLLCVVHDEDNICAPAAQAEGAMLRLREAMDAPRFDVPFMSEGYFGPNWADLQKWKE